MPAIIPVEGDITRMTVDAIVNAANTSLGGGAGVNGAVHAAGGPGLLAETGLWYPHGLGTGDAAWTTAGKLPARWVIHTVGPVHSRTQDRSATLASCYRESLRLAATLGARSVAFPAISAGVYGWPMEDAAWIAVRTCREMAADAGPVATVVFVPFSAAAEQAFRAALDA